jgi:enamine deaminase RidA (YjgF/YER057c/UK114 family)
MMTPIHISEFPANARHRRIDPGWGHTARHTFSPAIVCDGWVFVSGLVASGPGRTILCKGDIVGQTALIYERLGEILRAASCDYGNVVVTREFIVSSDNYHKTADVRRRVFTDPFPAATGVIVAGLLQPDALIEIEAIARVPDRP